MFNKNTKPPQTFRAFTASLMISATAFTSGAAMAKDNIHALYIPLADHYPAIVAHHKYAATMTNANYSVEMMKSWPALSAKFMAGEADLAFIMAPLAMNMYNQKQNFKWVSLVHRDGSALAVNDIFLKDIPLASERHARKPTADFANAASRWMNSKGRPTIAAVPSLHSTHTVMLYKYLKDHGKTMSIGQGKADVLVKAVAPSDAPAYIQNQGKNGLAASFEQSLPWADIVEAGGYGKVVWYSKDVMKWPKGHVECIIIASDNAIKNKTAALREVIQTVHRAGKDIDHAMNTGGSAINNIALLVNQHYIKQHTVAAIKASLNKDLGVINYVNLNNDKPGLKIIMDLAVESGVMKKAIDIDTFADDSFASKITVTQ
ncbi:MAG: NitT/TauT family transport system substrate-binding protein [Phenylobacterium sp.]|jgi:NitT/TauT family transport system substrate-binding protein